ncbi:hypothetical protein HW115_14880 [Verrucomicrobiaceae bacterium N1E253]|uniref:3-deoxy-D-manno-octulosonic acid transferase n=1 Tax=Oceaniferula marina TaxID=2748318 RepID=A0A851GHS2_9BACT|nr:glycosyltransferase N-terminal domain-containing protein [Oceaniferula marina]NWK56906.1 hypothetical protein [Oceaniferula marina]
MPRPLVLFIYNVLLPVFFIVAFPAWLLKMWKRGGYGSGLLQRFARYREAASDEPKQVVYVHAVSVGEVLIALKLIDTWLRMHPDERFVLAATTATGHEVAREKAPGQVRVIYSPIDFGFLVRAVFRRFSPSQVVLIESEAWPNLLNVARLNKVPVSMVNARLSRRSEQRFRKFSAMTLPLFEMVGRFCVQNDEDAGRFRSLGIEEEKITLTGSIKFDPAGGAVPRAREEFQEMLDGFGPGRRVVMIASTHPGEERALAETCKRCREDFLLVVVPRHAERRAEVKAELESLGLEVVLRSAFVPPGQSACLVVDSTGELRDWTAHADVMVIGKSWLGEGGQNPAEAIVAGVPVVCGPHMGNFEPLISMLRESGGVEMLSGLEELAGTVDELLVDVERRQRMVENARKVLSIHDHAVERTVRCLR